jgi:hypothetical protein
MTDLRTVAQQALAQQEQEPVAWMLYDGQAFETNRCDYHDGAEWTPLYTHPPRREWQGLTVEFIREAIDDNGLDWHNGWTVGDDSVNRYLNLARAIEAKLKERNT